MPEESRNLKPIGSARKRDGDIRFAVFVVEYLLSQYGKDVFLKRSLPLPSLSSLAEDIHMSRNGVWKIVRKLMRDDLVRAAGEGKNTRYRVRSFALFIDWARRIYGKRAAASRYIPYSLPAPLRSLSWQEKISYLNNMASRSDMGADFCFCLHSAMRLSGKAVYKGNEIEIMAPPEALEALECALRLSPLVPKEYIQRQRPRLQGADLIVIESSLADLAVEANKDLLEIESDSPLIRQVVNFFELERYPRRGVEASERIFEQWRRA